MGMLPLRQTCYDCVMQTQSTIAELDSALHQMLDENEVLRAQLAGLRDENKRQAGEIKRLVDWINGDVDALSTLQRIYTDPTTTEGNRVKAAASALPFERSKVTFNVKVGPVFLGERRDQAGEMKTVPPLIEHQP